jgi:hypothetical protein
VQSRYYYDSVEISLTYHLLLGAPQATPHYVANRPLFHSKPETSEGKQELYLKMKIQILDIVERSKWDDEVVGHWEKTSECLKNYKDIVS